MISILNPLTDERYRTFIEQDPRSTIFHTPEWMQVLTYTYKFKPVVYATIEGKEISGVVPFCETRSILGKKRIVSLPFSDFCEPLVTSGSDIRTVIDGIVNANRVQFRFIEFRGGNTLLRDEVVGCTMYTHEINCCVPETELFYSFRSSVQRNIRKAERTGLIFSANTSRASVKAFYELNCVTRREHGLPPQPWIFFENIWMYCIQKGNGFVANVHLDDTVVAAALFLTFGKKAYYKFGASLKDFTHLRSNDFMLWRSIQYCKMMNCKTLNLGRTELEHVGLLRFKRGWGGNEKLIAYYRYIVNRKLFTPIPKILSNSFYPALLSKMPIMVLKPIGSFIYQFAG